MTTSEKMFGNIFDRRNITNLRLSNFAEDCLNRFTTLAIEGQFAGTITEITNALNNLRSEIGHVDTRMGTQKLKTIRTDEFVDNFKKTMKAVEGMVVFISGSKNSDLYHELYPNGIKEYSSANKTKMPVLMNRMNDIATRYATQLSPDLATALSALKTQWSTLRTDQEKQMTKVDDSRAERTVARRQLEMALMNAMHTVALEFPLEIELCERFFNFRMLTATVHHEGEEGEEGSSVAANAVTEGDDEAMKMETQETPQEMES